MSDTPGPSICPKCGGDTRVLETVAIPGAIRRRRVCAVCGNRHQSLEVAGAAEKAARAALSSTAASAAAENEAIERLGAAAERFAKLPREARQAAQAAMDAVWEWLDRAYPAGKP